MNLSKATQVAAQELADRCHAWLIANDEAYAASVVAGQTTAWAVPRLPHEVCDMGGIVIATVTAWTVPVSERVMGALTDAERAELPLLPAEPFLL